MISVFTFICLLLLLSMSGYVRCYCSLDSLPCDIYACLKFSLFCIIRSNSACFVVSFLRFVAASFINTARFRHCVSFQVREAVARERTAMDKETQWKIRNERENIARDTKQRINELQLTLDHEREASQRLNREIVQLKEVRVGLNSFGFFWLVDWLAGVLAG